MLIQWLLFAWSLAVAGLLVALFRYCMRLESANDRLRARLVLVQQELERARWARSARRSARVIEGRQ